jgi:hypothetical protein
MSDKRTSLRENQLWIDTYNLVEDIYEALDGVASEVLDSNWAILNKVRTGATDSLYFVAQGVGSNLIENTTHEWSSASKSLFALETTYILACKQNFLELEPKNIVIIDSLIAKISDQQKLAHKAMLKRNSEELESYQEKFRLWEKMNNQ